MCHCLRGYDGFCWSDTNTLTKVNPFRKIYRHKSDFPFGHMEEGIIIGVLLWYCSMFFLTNKLSFAIRHFSNCCVFFRFLTEETFIFVGGFTWNSNRISIFLGSGFVETCSNYGTQDGHSKKYAKFRGQPCGL